MPCAKWHRTEDIRNILYRQNAGQQNRERKSWLRGRRTLTTNTHEWKS